VALYYCTRGDITDLLPSLVGTDISTTAQQDAKLRRPAKEWIDSVYPGRAPFAGIPVNDAIDWQVNQSDHAGGDNTVVVDGGTGDPAVGDLFRVVGDYQWDDERTGTRPEVDDSQEYRVTAYSSNTITYEPFAAIDFVDNAPLNFGTPNLVRQAAMLYSVHKAFQIIRDNVLDKEAGEALKMAMMLLHIPEGKFLAKARPESTSNAVRATRRVALA
jgi:hypothetical protein